MKKVTLKSGKELGMNPAPFLDAKALYQAIMIETKGLDFGKDHDSAINIMKELFFTYLSSKQIEAALWECLKRCTYAGHKITPDTFEEVSAREDYVEICFELAKENVLPFLKNLYALFEKGQELFPKEKSPA